jgi:hypothetical protein
MTPEHVLSLIERHYLAGKAPADLEATCASYADWLASAWDLFDAGQQAMLVAVGAALWREGYNLRAGTATKDLW